MGSRYSPQALQRPRSSRVKLLTMKPAFFAHCGPTPTTKEAHRNRFTICNASHDPNTMRSIVPAKST